MQMATNTRKRTVGERVIHPELSYLLTGVLFSVQNELGLYAREKQFRIIRIDSPARHRREISIIR